MKRFRPEAEKPNAEARSMTKLAHVPDARQRELARALVACLDALYEHERSMRNRPAVHWNTLELSKAPTARVLALDAVGYSLRMSLRRLGKQFFEDGGDALLEYLGERAIERLHAARRAWADECLTGLWRGADRWLAPSRTDDTRRGPTPEHEVNVFG
jgi:hypothetical protein